MHGRASSPNDAGLFGHSPIMSDAPTTVLLVEANADDAGLIQGALAGALGGVFSVECVARLSDAIERLREQDIQVVLLDLTLPDGAGITVFDRVHEAAPDALIIVLGEASDHESACQAMQHGAHDYLTKGHLDAYWLPRALRYAIEQRRSREALRDSEARFRATSDASPLGIFVSDALGRCVYANAAYLAISGRASGQTLGTSWSAIIHPVDSARVLAEWDEAASGETSFSSEARALREDGEVIWIRLNAAPLGDGKTGYVQTVEDITARKATESGLRAAEEDLFAEKERAQVTLNSIGDAVLTTDLAGNVTYLNVVAEAMTGWWCGQALGRPLAEVFTIIDGTSRQAMPNPAQRAIEENRIVGLATDCVLIRRDGFESAIEDSAAPIHTRDGRVAGAVIVFHDVSQSRAMTEKMAHLAQHDFLTDLPNRLLLTERLVQAVGLAHRNHKQLAILYLDMDHFKRINDSLGHEIGDQMLQAVAGRLTACVRTTDTVCRQGGDEFVILLPEIERPQDGAGVAEKLLAALAVPEFIDGHELHAAASIGISVYPDDGADAATVMQNADMAMYHAKANGRNNYQFFTAEMNGKAVERLAVEGRLHRALKQDEFELYYQPKTDLVSGAITGAEALIRWRDPDLGQIQPDGFVRVAEECGLIVPIGKWVLGETCRQIREWLNAGLPVVPVAVNVSPAEFRHKDFLEGFARILAATGVMPLYVQIEITESLLMHDVESSMVVLRALKDMGVGLAIDDFGTGYSSLSYLKRFPIDALKIDQSFVRDIPTDADDASIVAAVIGLGIRLRRRVIAEGVETEDQLAFLRSHQCDEVQGFLFGRPMPGNEFAALLGKGLQTRHGAPGFSDTAATVTPTPAA
jgi:diguanylate cyclase (GGDEF)-like protein/PAS domain S-box-containing protein